MSNQKQYICEQIAQHKLTIAHLQAQSALHPDLFARTIARHQRDIKELQNKLNNTSIYGNNNNI